jgi:hypothetical protein
VVAKQGSSYGGCAGTGLGVSCSAAGGGVPGTQGRVGGGIVASQSGEARADAVGRRRDGADREPNDASEFAVSNRLGCLEGTIVAK